ncbi:hypothetical protein AtEden1_Chr2g0228931 [Arabidopsis thaliana]
MTVPISRGILLSYGQLVTSQNLDVGEFVKIYHEEKAEVKNSSLAKKIPKTSNLGASTSDKLELARAITTFKEEEIRHLAEPDDVDFVLTLDVADVGVSRIVIDVGSLIDLLFLSTLGENGK